MCVFFFSFFLGCLIYCYVQFVACTFVTCSNKNQLINQSTTMIDRETDKWHAHVNDNNHNNNSVNKKMTSLPANDIEAN